jgi:hypothetical protein
MASALNRTCSMPPTYGKDERKAVGTSGMLLHTKKIMLRHNLADHKLKFLFVMLYTAAYSCKSMTSFNTSFYIISS